MSDNSKELVQGAIGGIFTADQKPEVKNPTDQGKKKFKRGKAGPDKRELELAVTVLLVDLASCDQNFDPQEYHVIINGLMRIFGTSKDEVSKLINQANLALANLRGVGRFAKLLKDNLDIDTKNTIMEVIEDIIMADGEEDGFETYLRHKFADLLGIPLNAPGTEGDDQEQSAS